MIEIVSDSDLGEIVIEACCEPDQALVKFIADSLTQGEWVASGPVDPSPTVTADLGWQWGIPLIAQTEKMA